MKRWFASDESWKYSTGQKNCVQAFVCYSAESEPIWMKYGEVWANCWGMAALADFGRNPQSSDSLRGSRNFFCVCVVNNARLPVGQILLHLNTTT